MYRSMSINYHVPGQVRPWVVGTAMLFLVLPSCDWPNDNSDSGRDYRDRLASVGGVSVPDSAALGSVFYVTIGTNASNGCWQQGSDKVLFPATMLARIMPYDREYISDVCPQNAPTFEHAVPVTAPEAGKLKIEVLSRLRAVSGKDSLRVIERFVTVY